MHASSQGVVPGSAATAELGNLLEIQIPGPHPCPAKLETLGPQQAGSGLLMPDKAETHRPV